jgi:DNA-binding transcriptional regulator YiaG
MPQEWFAFQIRELRSRTGMTRREFADLMDVSTSTVGKWETGRHPPTRDHRVALTAIDRMHRTVFSARQLPG